MTKSFDRKRLIGAWQLARWFITSEDGTVEEPLGAGAEGLLLFTPDGWMTSTMMAAGRPRLSRGNTRAALAEERAAAFDTFVSYTCRWRVVGQTVELQVMLSQNPAMVGTLQVRRIQLRGRTLTVSTEDALTGQRRVHRLRWRPAVPPDSAARATKRKSTGGKQT
jgi:hypothetical protein